MKITKTTVKQAHVLGFISGVVFANAVHAAIALPFIIMHHSGGAKGKHNWHHHGDHSHPAAGPMHFLAEQNARQARDEHELLAEIKDELAEIKANLPEHPAAPHPEPDDGPAPESPKPGQGPNEGPEPPKPEPDADPKPEPDESAPEPPKPEPEP